MLLRLLVGSLLVSSAFAQGTYDPVRRYSVEQLQKDFGLLRRALEEGHPGLYWYASKADMDSAFALTARQLNRTMTEEEFRKHLSPLIARIHCGHTGVFLSKKSEHYFKKHRPPLLPFETGFYSGKLYVTENHSSDSTLRAGAEVLSIEGEPVERIAFLMRALIPADGYNQTHKNVRISSSFPGYYRLLYGDRDTVSVSVRDSAGVVRPLRLASLSPRTLRVLPKVTGQPTPNTPQSKPRKSEQRRVLRFSDPDSTGASPPVALLNVYTFDDRGYSGFYRRAFRKIERRGSKSLIINIRANGGGYSAAGRALLRYLMDSSFRFSASMIAPRRRLSVGQHLSAKTLRFLARNLFSKNLPDGRLALRSGDDVTRPVRHHRFTGDVYVLTNGGTFSAAAIVAANLQTKCRAVIVGRETGGGRAGCNAAYIPFLTLPNTDVRVRFPLYRVLTDVRLPNEGRGVRPDHEINYTIREALAGKDLDVKKALDLIKEKHRQQKSLETTMKTVPGTVFIPPIPSNHGR
ncbi:MAG: hypothetical protein LH606_22560 [Cytophagaceae bacterium]|nr:hypothetical protein [Cytophagaceae bacterium]